jgi:hypothetical protein
MGNEIIDGLRARIRTAFRNNPRLTAHSATLTDLADPYLILGTATEGAGDGGGIRVILTSEESVADMDALPLGASRFGGVPDLPPAIAWPEIEGKKLLFLAQIDFAALPRWDGDPLPAEGWLYAFVMFSTKETVGLPPWKVVVLHHRGPREALVRAAQPLEEEMWPEWATNPIEGYDLVPLEPRLGLSIGLENLRRAGLEDLIDYVVDDVERVIPRHDGGSGGYLLGHPGIGEESANAMVRDLVSYGAWPGEDEANGADDWLSLLTIFSVGSMQWSDAGEFYLFIRRSDLARGDFSRVRTSMTSG